MFKNRKIVTPPSNAADQNEALRWNMGEMHMHSWLSHAFVVACFGLAFFARSDAASKPKTAQVMIPFDFWVQNTMLPAGSYELSHISSPTLLVFTDSDHKKATEVFMLPVNADPVKANESKLVFLIQNNQRYLYEIWCVYGRRIVSAEYGIAAPTGDSRVEVSVAYQ
jgi:hypothetical protein